MPKPPWSRFEDRQRDLVDLSRSQSFEPARCAAGSVAAAARCEPTLQAGNLSLTSATSIIGAWFPPFQRTVPQPTGKPADAETASPASHPTPTVGAGNAWRPFLPAEEISEGDVIRVDTGAGERSSASVVDRAQIAA